MEGIIEKLIELTKKDSKTLIERTLKGAEELGEIAQAVLSCSQISGCTYKGKTKDDVIEECVDELMVILSIIVQVQGYKFNVENFKSIFKLKMDKWENKISGNVKK